MYKKILLTIVFIILLVITPPITMNAVCDFSKKIQVIENYCNIYNLDTELVIAIVMTESSFRHKVVKWEKVVNENAYGLGQVLLSTARIYDKNITPNDLLNADKNIEITIRHLAMLDKKHNGDMENITREYNGGTRKKNNRGYYLRVKYYYDALNKTCGGDK